MHNLKTCSIINRDGEDLHAVPDGPEVEFEEAVETVFIRGEDSNTEGEEEGVIKQCTYVTHHNN